MILNVNKSVNALIPKSTIKLKVGVKVGCGMFKKGIARMKRLSKKKYLNRNESFGFKKLNNDNPFSVKVLADF